MPSVIRRLLVAQRRYGPAPEVLVSIAALMGLSVLLRTGVFGGVGEYSDIVHLYRRDGLADHPAPYFDYRLEYPVLIGVFEWVVGFAKASASLYFVASAAALAALALGTAWALGQIRSANPWLLAAAPAVVFWGVQNWDFVGIFPMVVAIALHERRRDAWGAAALALAVSAKFFPIVVLPVVLAVRAAEHRWRTAGMIVAVFTSVTVAVNAPFAIEVGREGGVGLRSSWEYFFEFSRDRDPLATLWTTTDLSVVAVNRATGLLLALGLAVILALTVWCVRRGHDVLVCAAAAALLWFFATNKVYSAQYALWILLALALANMPLQAALAFVGIDVIVFIALWGGLPWLGDLPFFTRQITTVALAAWVGLRMVRSTSNPTTFSPGACL
jgi:uncharacterized membrane protein